MVAASAAVIDCRPLSEVENGLSFGTFGVTPRPRETPALRPGGPSGSPDGRPLQYAVVKSAARTRPRAYEQEECLMDSCQESLAPEPYTFRVAQGVWINDMRNRALSHRQWPCVDLDRRAMDDLAASFRLQAESGYNCVTLFGLLTASSWSSDIPHTVPPERAAKVRAVLAEAHANGLKVLYGLGGYSWGFDQIIALDPAVRGDNRQAMCGSRPESRQWMKRVIDYLLEEFTFDGFHLEASDQGRCNCARCSSESNTAYYSRLNAETAAVIRGIRPEALLMVNMCGYLPPGQTVPHNDWEHLQALSRQLDFLIDPGHSEPFIEPSARREFIRSLDCAFGTSGGTWVYPPQRWQRLRWFIPYTRRTGQHLEELHADGGRAVEYYMGPSRNPGVEVNLAFGGRKLATVEMDNRDALLQVLDELYHPRTSAAVNDLAGVFEEAEEAFFTNYRRRTEASAETLGQIHLTPLAGRQPGPPRYLNDAMTEAGRADYCRRLGALLPLLDRLEPKCRSRGRIRRMQRCIRAVLTERR